MTSDEAADLIEKISPKAIQRLNELAGDSLQTRGGRAGSGLGSLLEALWGFMINVELRQHKAGKPIDLAWFPDHAYNDFACLLADAPWNPITRDGELLRVEAKSMFSGADESKAHFDALIGELGSHDVLVVLIWAWLPVAGTHTQPRVAPQVIHSFVGSAREIAAFRDSLHISRGGRFVSVSCPDGCSKTCKHLGEPLNADGKRERRSGPSTRKPANASYAANFGGLVRMLKTNSPEARREFRRWRSTSPVAHRFISFMHTAFPTEEANQYLTAEWRECAKALGIMGAETLPRLKLLQSVRELPDYQEALRALYVESPQ